MTETQFYEQSQIPLSERVRGALERLDVMEGLKCLVIMIDDTEDKIVSASRLFRNTKMYHIQEIHSELQGFLTGTEGLAFYRAVCGLEDPQHQRPITMFIDSDLEGSSHRDPNYKLGINVVKQVDAIRREYGLKMPYLIGLSSDDNKNEDLRKFAPDAYLGSYSEGLDAMDELVKRLAA